MVWPVGSLRAADQAAERAAVVGKGALPRSRVAVGKDPGFLLGQAAADPGPDKVAGLLRGLSGPGKVDVDSVEVMP